MINVKQGVGKQIIIDAATFRYGIRYMKQFSKACKEAARMLVLTRKSGEGITLDQDITIDILAVEGDGSVSD